MGACRFEGKENLPISHLQSSESWECPFPRKWTASRSSSKNRQDRKPLRGSLHVEDLVLEPVDFDVVSEPLDEIEPILIHEVDDTEHTLLKIPLRNDAVDHFPHLSQGDFVFSLLRLDNLFFQNHQV